MCRRPPIKISTDRREAIERFIHEHAAGAEDPPECHWFSGDAPGWEYDAGQDFCSECAEAVLELFYEEHPELEERDEDGEVDREARTVQIDGGWSTDHDSLPFCEECGRRLTGHLTEYGVEQELEHFAEKEHYIGRGCPETWAGLEVSLMNLADDDARWYDLEKLVEHARAEEQAAAQREAEVSAEPGITEARGDLVRVLAHRFEQLRPGPAFALWAELQEFLAVRYRDREESPRWQAVERRLRRAAEVFLRQVGGIRYAGGEFAKAPYGEFWWTRVLETEVFKLWQHPAFLLGHAAELARQSKRCAQQRLDPPYPEGSLEYRAWTAGEMVAGSHR